MKLRILLVLFIAVIFSFNSCEKDEDGNIIFPSMTATVDGTAKNFIFRSTSKVGITDGLDGIVIIATTGAEQKDGEYLTMLIRGAKLGEYNLDIALSSSAKFQCEAIYRPGGDGDSTIYKGKTGTITITKMDEKYISGTFDFSMVNSVLDTETKTVSNGKFENLRYFSASLQDIADVAFDLAE